MALFILVVQRYVRPTQKYYPRPVITNFESKMFARLNQSFPEYHILAQVAFSALITHHNMKVRAKFNRKVTDFVILDKKLQVIAIIELDDPTHIGKEQEDAERDAMLLQAGYQVYRYTNIPSPQSLRRDILNHS
nr:DUF2726 domain-containing protein [Acinetobacter portensis]